MRLRIRRVLGAMLRFLLCIKLCDVVFAVESCCADLSSASASNCAMSSLQLSLAAQICGPWCEMEAMACRTARPSLCPGRSGPTTPAQHHKSMVISQVPFCKFSATFFCGLVFATTPLHILCCLPVHFFLLLGAPALRVEERNPSHRSLPLQNVAWAISLKFARVLRRRRLRRLGKAQLRSWRMCSTTRRNAQQCPKSATIRQ